ncbi:DUF2243 domain-containing protein [Leptolyngbya sp. FACHB-261]|uniref:DUF2243 domain-containing protein n=1 Tax=Leptolyngbya sp. FACHB-261 TaxID=2692806 RepID=UPI00168506C2|nr:DUF2243 domain-containing protein [Leptolyngbya sp. FACHB-261]MBD2102051.1 DUF2243 domain-containing protein [Leptolyngbya sp. FACHB-261]
MTTTASPPTAQPASAKPLVAPGFFLGLGLAGFFDGIVLHQILQWHHMLTDAGYSAETVSGLEINTLADGFFHLGSAVLTAVGVGLLWRVGRQVQAAGSGRVFGGALLLGAGTFNLVEGLIDHYILQIHHVKSGPHEAAWDLGFLIVAGLLMAIGWGLMQSGLKLSASGTAGREPV